MVWALSQMFGGMLTIVKESGPLQLAVAADTFSTPCFPALSRPADLDVGQLKDHRRFEGCYSRKKGMGGLVASDICAV